MSEFDLINQYFKSSAIQREDVVLGIGDDCALLSPRPGQQLAVSTDTFICGVHFPEQTSAADIGYKALAVNLSDLAAMGAEPAWVSLAISLPEADSQWLQEFMQGFQELANQHNVSLVGGDTTRGPLSITISVMGYVFAEKSLKRNKAKQHDMVCVTGCLGDAAIGLQLVQQSIDIDQQQQYLIDRLNRPTAQVKAGQILSNYRVAAIDLSDGLAADLGHICHASQCGACIYLDQLPLSEPLKQFYESQFSNGLADTHQPDWQRIVTAGDDYELCFCCSPHDYNEIAMSFNASGIAMQAIGEIVSGESIGYQLNGQSLSLEKSTGYQHF